MRGKSATNLAILLALAAAVGGAIALKNKGPQAGGQAVPVEQAGDAEGSQEASLGADAPFRGIPRFLDLGAGNCIPCKKMMPVMDELRREYPDTLEVVYVDIRHDRSASKRFGLRLIPTQIFFDGQGKELFRHMGFIAKEGILAKWKELGFDLAGN